MPLAKAPAQRLSLLPGQIRGGFAAGTANDEERTVEVVWSTGAVVRRYGKINGEWIDYEEELEVTEEACDVSRLNAGGAVLDSHMGWSLATQIGASERAWFKGGKGYALLRFLRHESNDRTWQGIRDGIFRGVSIGYRVSTYEEVTKLGAKVRRFRAVKWAVHEISILPIQADARAQVRGAAEASTPTTTAQEYDCLVLQRPTRTRSQSMDPEIEPTEENREQPPATGAQPTTAQRTAPPPAPPGPTASELEQRAAAAATAERQRVLGIQELVARHNLPAQTATDLIALGASVEQARLRVLEDLAVLDRPTRSQHAPAQTQERGNWREAMSRALSDRLDTTGASRIPDGDDEARRYRPMSLLRLCEEVCSIRGIRADGWDEQITGALRAHHGTSDFALLLADVGGKSLKRAYAERPGSWEPLSRMRRARDFKDLKVMQLGDAPGMLEVPESGEVKYGTITEGRELLHVLSFARRIGLTRKAIVNDDLDAFGAIPEKFARKIRINQANIVWGLVTGNQTLEDGNGVFHTNHANIGTKALSVDGLNALQVLLAKQTSLGGDLLNLQGNALVVPPELWMAARQLVMPMQPNEVGKVNPFQGQFRAIVNEARLSAAGVTNGTTSWWMVDLDEEALCHVLLDGAEEPRFKMREGFEVQGVEYLIEHDFGAGFVDYRSWARSNGTT